jgi:hypothetical protein
MYLWQDYVTICVQPGIRAVIRRPSSHEARVHPSRSHGDD